MSEASDAWNNNKGWIFGVTAGIAALVGGCGSYKAIDSGHFGVHRRMGKILSDTLSPGVHWKWPIVESIDELQNNTIIMETTAGKDKNTADQNMLSAQMRLHYTIDPKEGVLALHLDKMADDNGQELLDDLMDQSFNAVVGQRKASEYMADTESMLGDFAENLEWRLKQNNVPISVDAAELLIATIGDGPNPYRTPVQLRIRRVDGEGKQGWKVEQMAGPGALPVQSGGQTIKPVEKVTVKDSLTLKP